MLTYVNMNMKKTQQSYDARLCLILLLDILKEMRGRILIYTLLGIEYNEAYKEASMCASNKEISWEPS
jgi:hypothetical protein